MIQSSFSLLPNLAITQPPSEPQTLPHHPEEKKRLAHERIFNFLIEKGIVTENGSFNVNFEHLVPTDLKPPQQKRLNALFNNPFTVKPSDHSFSFNTSLQEIFCYLKIKKLEIVGGTIFYILGREYMEELVRSLKIPEDFLADDFYAEFEKPAADVDIRVSCTCSPDVWKEEMLSYFMTKLPGLKRHEIKEVAFLKYCTVPESTDSHFSIVSFGDRADFSIDLLFVKKLRRANLFKHDGLKLDIHLDQNLSGKLKPRPSHSLLESLLLKLAKTLDAHEPHKIDSLGSAMLLAYLTKGWQCCSKSLANQLLSQFLNSKDTSHLPKIIRNHFPNVPFAPLVLFLNACYLLPTEKRSLAKALLPIPESEDDNFLPKLLHQALTPLASDDITEEEATHLFNLVTACLQFFGVSRITIYGEPHLQLTFQSTKPLHLFFKEDLKGTVKDAFSLLEEKESALKTLGFCSLCTLKKEYLSTLLTHFLPLIENESKPGVRKNIFQMLFEAWPDLQSHSTEMENFRKAIHNPDIKPQDLIKAFCLNFAVVSNLQLAQIIFETWKKRPELFNEQPSLNLAEKFAAHSPRLSLKIITYLLEISPKNVQKVKKIFDPILNSYLKPESEVALAQDINKVAKTTYQLISRMEKYASPPKQEEIEVYLRLLKHLLLTDFDKGVQFFDLLKSKGAVTGTQLLLDLSPLERRQKLAGTLIESSPIDFKKTSSRVLEERLIILVNHFSDVDEALKFLKEILEHKCSVSKNFKGLLKPHLERILIHFLTQAVESDFLSVYFKLAEAFDPQIVLSKDLISALSIILKTSLQIDRRLENIKFIEENLRKILSLHHANKTILNADLIELIEQLLNCYNKEKNAVAIFGFLTYLEEKFPKVSLPNSTVLWKEIILNLPEKEKVTLFNKKASFFLNDQKIVSEVEKHTLLCLKKAETGKGKAKEEHFQSALNFIQAYHLNSPTVIKHLEQTLLILKTGNLCKTTYLTLQKINTPIDKLLPIFKVIAELNPELFSELLKQQDKLLAEFKSETAKKIEFIYILMEGCLNQLGRKPVNAVTVCKDYLALEQELKKSGKIAQDKSTHFGLKFLQSFSKYLKEIKIYEQFWKKLLELSCLTNLNEHEVAEMFVLFSKALLIWDSNNTLETLPVVEAITANLGLYVTSSNTALLLEPLLVKNAKPLLGVCCLISTKTIAKAKVLGNQADLDFQDFLKKLIMELMHVKLYDHIIQIIKCNYFKKQEIFGMYGALSKAIFDNPASAINAETMARALDIYLLNLRSPYESAEFAEENLKSAIYYLLAIEFVHKDYKTYSTYLSKMIRVFAPYFMHGSEEDRSVYLEFLAARCEQEDELQQLPKPPSLKKIKIMKEKFYNFLFILNERTSSLILEKKTCTKQMQCIGVLNYDYFLPLIDLYPTRGDELTSLCLKYGVSLLGLEPEYFNVGFPLLRKVFFYMAEEGCFSVPFRPEYLDSTQMLLPFLKITDDEIKDVEKFKAFQNISNEQKIDHIFALISMMWKPDSLHSYGFVFEYLNTHEILLKEAEKETRVFTVKFFEEFRRKFPQIKDAPRILTAMIHTRRQTPPHAALLSSQKQDDIKGIK